MDITKTKLFRPVYLGGGLNPKQKFLAPMAEDGILNKLRQKYNYTLEPAVAPAAHTGLQLDFSSKFLPNPSMNYDSQDELQSPSKISLLHDKDRWN